MRATPTQQIGTDAPRRVNRALLTGQAQYVADVRRDDQLYARMVRSQIAHARIAGIDTSAARALPGVVAVITADDIPDVRIPIRLPFAETPEAKQALQASLARDVVRYVGEPVAVVVAVDPYIAEDAAELVIVDLEELRPVLALDPDSDPEAPPVHEGLGRNVVNVVPLRYGDVDAAFARADIVLRRRFRVHRHTAQPIETRGVVAEYDEASDRLTIWGATKVKHFTRAALGGMLGLDPSKIRVVEVNVGGGFGVRGEPYPEDFLVAFLARELRRPVHWVEDRAEHFVATNHAREQEHDIEIAAASDGTLLAFRDRAWCDQGAYVRSQGLLAAVLPVLHLPGPYRWEAFSIESAAVLSNRTPVGTYRGPGMTEAAFVRERMLDLLAGELELDTAELRRQNLVPPDAMPFRFEPASGSAPIPPIIYESGDFVRTFDEVLAAADYHGLRRRQQKARALGECVGIGLAAYVEIGSVGPYEEAHVVPSEDGIVVRVGVASLGQGVETALAQIAADCLGVPIDDIAIEFRDTDEIPFGFGAFASRSTVLAGNAIASAAQKLRARAAEQMGVGADDICLVESQARGPDGSSIALSELGEARGRYEKPQPSFSFGAVLSSVSVERETGRTKVLRYVLAHDVGRAVNPRLLRGQLAGAAAQGVGAALFEELAYDDQGQPLTGSFADYLMPTVSELPEVEVIIIEHPTPANPLGIKGGGEAGMVGSLGSLANAVADALGPEAAEVTKTPLTPDSVRALLRDATST